MKPIRTTAPSPAAQVTIRSRRSPKRSRRRLPPRSPCVIGTALIAAHANARLGLRSGLLPDRYQSHTAFQPTPFPTSLSLGGDGVENGEERDVKRMSLVALAVVVLAAWTGLAAASSQKASLTGAGSTFVAPLVSQWISHYSAAG